MACRRSQTAYESTSLELFFYWKDYKDLMIPTITGRNLFCCIARKHSLLQWIKWIKQVIHLGQLSYLLSWLALQSFFLFLWLMAHLLLV